MPGQSSTSTQIDQMSRLASTAVCHLTPRIRSPILLGMAADPTQDPGVEYGPPPAILTQELGPSETGRAYIQGAGGSERGHTYLNGNYPRFTKGLTTLTDPSPALAYLLIFNFHGRDFQCSNWQRSMFVEEMGGVIIRRRP